MPLVPSADSNDHRNDPIPSPLSSPPSALPHDLSSCRRVHGLFIRRARCWLSYVFKAAITGGVNHVNGVLIIYAAKWRREPRRKLEPEDGPDGERGEGSGGEPEVLTRRDFDCPALFSPTPPRALSPACHLTRFLSLVLGSLLSRVLYRRATFHSGQTREHPRPAEHRDP